MKYLIVSDIHGGSKEAEFIINKFEEEKCDYLIVGINSDELVSNYKDTVTIIKEKERAEIVESIKYVDKVVIVNSLDKMIQYNQFKFDVIFIGDDWKGNSRWVQTEKDLRLVNAKVCYLPHTDGISTTLIKSKRLSKNNNK